MQCNIVKWVKCDFWGDFQTLWAICYDDFWFLRCRITNDDDESVELKSQKMRIDDACEWDPEKKSISYP